MNIDPNKVIDRLSKKLGEQERYIALLEEHVELLQQELKKVVEGDEQ